MAMGIMANIVTMKMIVKMMMTTEVKMMITIEKIKQMRMSKVILMVRRKILILQTMTNIEISALLIGANMISLLKFILSELLSACSIPKF